MNLHELTITEASGGLAARKFSSREITASCLERIDATDQQTHAFLEVWGDEALAVADAVDRARGRGDELGPLAGIPLALKDNMLVADHVVSAASNILQNYRASYDAGVTQKLRQAGAVFLGRTNMDEFAMGSSTETSAFGVTRNPWNPEKVPGGSSGGSAAAVAAGSALGALGSDTGGSIRQPAALCGVVGLKPTYGRVSRSGLIALASSLDQIGPLAKTVHDAALLFAAISGKDPRDATTLEAEAPPPPKELRIGVPKEYFIAGIDSEVETSVRTAIDKMSRALGATVVPVSLPHTDYALAVYYVLQPAEVSANMARYDGIRYGRRVEAGALRDTYAKTRGSGFGAEVRRRIMLGTHALSSGYYDAYYGKAQLVRTLVRRDFDHAFTEVDVIATPTTPAVAWNLGEKFDDPLTMYLSDIFTVSANVAGLPAISVPCGLAHGLPVGLQLIGRAFDEATLFRAAEAYERVRGPFPRPK